MGGPIGGGTAGVRTTKSLTPLYNAALPNTMAKCAMINDSLDNNSMHLGCQLKVELHAAFAAAGLKLAQGKETTFHQFRAPFVLLEAATLAFSPLHKEYVETQPASADNSVRQSPLPYPTIFYESQDFSCPWVISSRLITHGRPLLVHPPPLELMAKASRHQQSQSILTKPLLSKKDTSLVTLRRLKQHNTVVKDRTIDYGLGTAPIPVIHTTIASSKAAADRPRPGYCECCYEKYSSLERHLRKEGHRRFAKATDYYRAVDEVAAALVRSNLRILSLTKIIDENAVPRSPPSPAKSQTTPPEKPFGNENYHPNPILQSPNPVAKPYFNHNPSNNHNNALRNVTNHFTMAKTHKAEDGDTAMILADVGSDSPLYSSPILKRRRSQRLVARAVIGYKDF